MLKENDERKLGRPRKSWDFNIIMDIREIYWKDGKQWRSEFFYAWGE